MKQNKRNRMLKTAFCVMVMVSCNCAVAQTDDFGKLASLKGVEYFHADKSMIEQAEHLNVGDVVQLGGNVLDVVDDVRVYTCENKKLARKMRKQVVKTLSATLWESLMDVKGDEGEVVKIYRLKEGDSYTTVVFTEDDEDVTLIVVKGSFDITDLMPSGAQ